MNKILNSTYELRCGNCLSGSNIHSAHVRIESIAKITTKIRNKIPTKSKKAPLQFLKVKLKNGFDRVALLDFAKHMCDQ